MIGDVRCCSVLFGAFHSPMIVPAESVGHTSLEFRVVHIYLYAALKVVEMKSMMQSVLHYTIE